MKGITSSDICAALRERYKQPEWCLFFEVANGTGGNAKRHADALAMNMYPSRGLAILGFEIKVSRSDLKRELDNPNKAEEVAQYCNEWWLAVPKGLIKPDDNIPIPWGIIECDNGLLRVTKKAQPLEPKLVTKSFMAAVLRSAGKVDEGTVRAARDAAYLKAEQGFKERLKQEIDCRTREFQKIKENIDAFEKATGKRITQYMNVDGLAERLKAAENMERLQSQFGSLQTLKRSIERFMNDVDKLIGMEDKAV